MHRRSLCRFAVAALVVTGACGREGPEENLGLAKLVPSGASSEPAWRLFDRSIASTFEPDDAPVALAFDRVEDIAAVKVYGPAPYLLDVTGAAGEHLGFERIDLQQLSAGWHTFAASEIAHSGLVELRFTPAG